MNAGSAFKVWKISIGDTDNDVRHLDCRLFQPLVFSRIECHGHAREEARCAARYFGPDLTFRVVRDVTHARTPLEFPDRSKQSARICMV